MIHRNSGIPLESLDENSHSFVNEVHFAKCPMWRQRHRCNDHVRLVDVDVRITCVYVEL